MAGMTEAQWQGQVVNLLDLYSWRWYHTHDSRRSPAGFPDLTAVKGSRVIFAELKREGEYPTRKQKSWLADLHAAGQEVAVWWPRDLEVVARCLGPRAERLILPERYRPENQ